MVTIRPLKKKKTEEEKVLQTGNLKPEQVKPDVSMDTLNTPEWATKKAGINQGKNTGSEIVTTAEGDYIVGRDQSGNPASLTTPDGRMLMGLNSEQIREIINRSRFKQLEDVTGQAGTAKSPTKEIERFNQIQTATQQLDTSGAVTQRPQLNEFGTTAESGVLGFNTGLLLPGFFTAQENTRLLELGLNQSEIEQFKQMKFKTMPARQAFIDNAIRNKTVEEYKKSSDIKVSGFAKFTESIPVVSSLANRYGFNLGSSTPTGLIKDHLEAIDKLNQGIEQDKKIATVSPDDALASLNAKEKEINEYERKIQLLALQSPYLSTHPQNRINIAIEIKNQKDKIFTAKQDIARLKLSQVGATPEETELLLMELNNKKT